jgi:hypothetical protein
MHAIHYCLIITFLYLIFVSSPIFAGPPFISDDPENLEAHHVEIDLYTNYSINGKDSTIDLPGIEIDYGITSDLELDWAGFYTFAYSDNIDTQNASAIGDMQIESKYSFVHETHDVPQIAFAPIYTVPSGNAKRNLGNGRSTLLLPLWAQKTIASWTIYGGGGYLLNSASDEKNYLLGGVVAEHNINDNWTVGSEIYSTGSQSISFKASTLLNLGCIYHISKTLNMNASAGHSFIGERQVVVYVGASWFLG